MPRAGATTEHAPRPEHRFVVLVGKDPFLRDHDTGALLGALRAEMGAVERFRFDGADAAPADVLDECRSFGLMAPHKVVIVDNAESFVNADSRPMLERYAHNPSDHATLVLRAASWHPGKLDKAIGRTGVVIKREALNEHDAAAWASRRASDFHGVELPARTAAAIVERLGTDLGRLDTELGKLATAAGEGAAITPELVESLVERTREEEVWAIQQNLLGGDAERTIAQLRIILGNTPRDNAVPAIFACSDLARKLVGACEGLRLDANPNQLGKELKLWYEKRDRVFSVARTINPATARRLFDMCVETDRLAKSSDADPRIALERLSVAFALVSRG